MFYFWPIFGALFGGLAAQRNGWNILAGVVGGALLGPLALLLLFVSGSGAETSGRSAGAQVGRCCTPQQRACRNGVLAGHSSRPPARPSSASKDWNTL